MKKTFKELLEIDNIVSQLYAKNPDLKETKFGNAYKRFFEKNISPTMDKFKNELQDARIDLALEDEKTKQIMKEPNSVRGYAYSKQGEKDIVAKEREISLKYETQEIAVESFISPFIPEMGDAYREALFGLVI